MHVAQGELPVAALVVGQRILTDFGDRPFNLYALTAVEILHIFIDFRQMIIGKSGKKVQKDKNMSKKRK